MHSHTTLIWITNYAHPRGLLSVFFPRLASATLPSFHPGVTFTRQRVLRTPTRGSLAVDFHAHTRVCIFVSRSCIRINSIRHAVFTPAFDSFRRSSHSIRAGSIHAAVFTSVFDLLCPGSV